MPLRTWSYSLEGLLGWAVGHSSLGLCRASPHPLAFTCSLGPEFGADGEGGLRTGMSPLETPSSRVGRRPRRQPCSRGLPLLSLLSPGSAWASPDTGRSCMPAHCHPPPGPHQP